MKLIVMDFPLSYLIIYLFATLLGSWSTTQAIRLARKFKILDIPNEMHKTHSKPVPYLGGLAIVIPVTFCPLPALYFGILDSSTVLSFFIILIPGLILSSVGLIDDISKLSYKVKLISQVLVSVLVSLLLLAMGLSTNVTNNEFFNTFITVLWIVVFTNAMNFVDNIDGGAIGLTLIMSIGIFLLGQWNGQFLIASLALVILGASQSLLMWNKSPAKIYLGDFGSLFIGYMLSILIIQYSPQNSSIIVSIMIPILLAAVPILDLILVVFSRLSKKVSIFQGNKDHISHRLLNYGYKTKNVARFEWALAAYFVTLAVLISKTSSSISVSFSILSILLLICTLFLLFNLRVD